MRDDDAWPPDVRRGFALLNGAYFGFLPAAVAFVDHEALIPLAGAVATVILAWPFHRWADRFRRAPWAAHPGIVPFGMLAMWAAIALFTVVSPRARTSDLNYSLAMNSMLVVLCAPGLFAAVVPPDAITWLIERNRTRGD